jgi:hypothetical protein
MPGTTTSDEIPLAVAVDNSALWDKLLNDLSDILEILDGEAEALVEDDAKTAALADLVEEMGRRVDENPGSATATPQASVVSRDDRAGASHHGRRRAERLARNPKSARQSPPDAARRCAPCVTTVPTPSAERSSTMSSEDRKAHEFDIVDAGDQWMVFLADYTPDSDEVATVAFFSTQAEAQAFVTIQKLIRDGFLQELPNGHLVDVCQSAQIAKDAIRAARRPPADDDQF